MQRERIDEYRMGLDCVTRDGKKMYLKNLNEGRYGIADNKAV